MSAIPFRYEGDGVFLARAHFKIECDRTFVVGEQYVLDVVEERQAARDRAYHAEMRQAWATLPDHLAAGFRTADDFRYWCLIECDFCTVSRLAFANASAARKAVSEFRVDGAQIGVSGSVVVIKRPLSQRHGRASEMDKETRARSYRETLDLAASLIGTSRDDLASNAARAA